MSNEDFESEFIKAVNVFGNSMDMATFGIGYEMTIDDKAKVITIVRRLIPLCGYSKLCSQWFHSHNTYFGTKPVYLMKERRFDELLAYIDRFNP